MKKLLFTVLALIFCLPFAFAETEKLEVAIFTSPACGHCQKFKREYLATLKQDFQDKVKFAEFDVSKPEDSVIFHDTLKEYGFGVESMGVPAMVVGKSVLLGYPAQIRTEGPSAILRALRNGEKTYYGTQATIEECKLREEKKTENCENKTQNTALEAAQSMFSRLTFWAIILAGLTDGINPCAFAVIVFFISFLSVYKYDKKEVILVGSAYCGAVFIAYVLIGLGLFNFLYKMSSFYYVMWGFKWLTIGLCALFLILSFHDFIVYQITKKSEKVILQLGKNNKERVHKIIRYFLRDKNKSAFGLFCAAVVVGFLVSLIEAVCTGQVYLPTIAVILKEANQDFLRAIMYLFVYNLMFIIPLVIIFVLSLLGYESKTFSDFLRKHLGLTKLALCLLFLGLLILLIVNM
ncbi:MAG: hypothetical protein J5594_04960 [Elusimicrobiaceae bacterium]|nr:hypothetical protein [Elusimicrobiaceae bacterium]